MQLFQKSVLKYHLSSLNKEGSTKAFEVYKKEYLSKSVQFIEPLLIPKISHQELFLKKVNLVIALEKIVYE